MGLTKSTMLALGSEAPDFALPEVISENIIRLDDFRGTTKALVLRSAFITCGSSFRCACTSSGGVKLSNSPATQRVGTCTARAASVRSASRSAAQVAA